MDVEKLAIFTIRVMDLIEDARDWGRTCIWLSRVKEGFDKEEWKEALETLKRELDIEYSFNRGNGLWVITWEPE